MVEPTKNLLIQSDIEKNSKKCTFTRRVGFLKGKIISNTFYICKFHHSFIEKWNKIANSATFTEIKCITYYFILLITSWSFKKEFFTIFFP